MDTAPSTLAGPAAAERGDAARCAFLLLLIVAAALARPLLPLDETRHAAIAWEMGLRGDFLVPHLNGQPDPHEPPLLPWLIQAGWALFGVQAWWPRLIAPLFAAGTLLLCARLAQRLWPRHPEAARMAPFILLANAPFAWLAGALAANMALAFFVALGLYGLVRAWRPDGGARGFALLGLGLAGALFAQGPVALVLLLPPVLLAPWWMREQRPARQGRWWTGLALAVLGGAALFLAWAMPAAMAGGPAYRDALFRGPDGGEGLLESFGPGAPWWMYIAGLPLLLAPWLAWPRWWPGLRHPAGWDGGQRLAALGLVVALAAPVAFSALGGPRGQTLLPACVFLALLAARALSVAGLGRRGTLLLPALTVMAVGVAVLLGAPRLAARLALAPAATAALALGGVVTLTCGFLLPWRRPEGPLPDVRRIASATVVSLAALITGLVLALREPYDVSEVAARLTQYEREGRPVALNAAYQGEWTLAGRLRRPVQAIRSEEVPAWLAAHPGGRVVLVHGRAQALPAGARVELQRAYRGGKLAIVAGD